MILATDTHTATDTDTAMVLATDTHIAPKGYGPEVFILQFQYTIQGGGLQTYDINKGKSFTIHLRLAREDRGIIVCW